MLIPAEEGRGEDDADGDTGAKDLGDKGLAPGRIPSRTNDTHRRTNHEPVIPTALVQHANPNIEAKSEDQGGQGQDGKLDDDEVGSASVGVNKIRRWPCGLDFLGRYSHCCAVPGQQQCPDWPAMVCPQRATGRKNASSRSRRVCLGETKDWEKSTFCCLADVADMIYTAAHLTHPTPS